MKEYRDTPDGRAIHQAADKRYSDKPLSKLKRNERERRKRRDGTFKYCKRDGKKVVASVESLSQARGSIVSRVRAASRRMEQSGGLVQPLELVGAE